MFDARRLWVAVCLFVPCPLFAAPILKPVSQYSIESWRTENGLPQSSINAILKSRDGHLWLATQEGLARYNGESFTVFDKTLIPKMQRDFILSLYEDGKQRIWAGTDKGLLLLSPGEEPRWFTTKNGLLDNKVVALARDPADPDGVLVAHRMGLVRFTGKFAGKDLFKKLDAGLLSNHPITALLTDRQGRLWVGDDAGNVTIPDNTLVFLRAVRKEVQEITAFLEEPSSGTFWIGTRGGGLFRRQKGKLLPVGLMGAETVLSMDFDTHTGSLWVGTDGDGLFRLTGERIEKVPGLSAGVIQALRVDGADLWAGTYGRGLRRLRDASFITYGKPEGVADDNVWCVLEDRLGQIWVGTDEGGLSLFKNGIWTTYGQREGLPHRTVRSLAEDRSGHLWIGTAEGVVRFDGARFQTYPLGASPQYVQVIYAAPTGDIWAGTRQGGLYRLVDGHFETFLSFDSDRPIRALTQDRQGRLWIGTGKGLDSILPGDNSSMRLLEENLILSLYEDPAKAGDLWVGTADSGLGLVRNGRLHALLDRKAGLLDDRIMQIVDDGHGFLWLTSNKGVSRVPKDRLLAAVGGGKQPLPAEIFGESDGLRERECNAGMPGAWKARDGRLWFATAKGVSLVAPTDLRPLPSPPEVRLERLIIDGEEQLLPQGKALSLPTGEHRLEVHYASPAFHAQEQLRYEHQLVNFDPEVSAPSNQRSVSYTNLKPGRYRFRVRALYEGRSGESPWNEELLTIEKQSQLYERAWFFPLLVASAATVGWSGHRWRIRRLRRHRQELRQSVEELTRELAAANQELEAKNSELLKLSHDLTAYSGVVTGAFQQERNLALTDPKTEIYNNRFFEQRLQAELKTARPGHPLSLLYLDIDHFKAYNDRFGHVAGDDCLRRVAQTLKTQAEKAGGFAARAGGEEFVVLLPGTGTAACARIAEEIRAAVEALAIPHSPAAERPFVTLSGGAATVPSSGSEKNDGLLEAANRQLLRAKKGGRNRVEDAVG